MHAACLLGSLIVYNQAASYRVMVWEISQKKPQNIRMLNHGLDVQRVKMITAVMSIIHHTQVHHIPVYHTVLILIQV